MGYGWEITCDYIDDGEQVGLKRGKLRNQPKAERENEIQIKLYDDDGELYFRGFLWGDWYGHEPQDWLECWGITETRYAEKGKAWKVL